MSATKLFLPDRVDKLEAELRRWRRAWKTDRNRRRRTPGSCPSPHRTDTETAKKYLGFYFVKK